MISVLSASDHIKQGWSEMIRAETGQSIDSYLRTSFARSLVLAPAGVALASVYGCRSITRSLSLCRVSNTLANVP